MAKIPSKKDSHTKGWNQGPPNDGFDKSMALYAEIISGQGFDGGRLFINYQVLTPAIGWSLRKGNTSDGVAENTKMYAHENFADAEGMLHGTTQKATESSSTSAQHLTHMDFFSRVIIATIFFLVACLAVIYGVEYPIWVVIVLIMFFMVGSGFPTGVVEVISYDKEGRLKSVSPLLDGEHYFNHLISLSFDFKSRQMEEPGLISSKVPTILLQAYSEGFMGKAVLEGYGYLHIQDEVSGSQDMVVKLWRPLGDRYAAMRDLFLGGSVNLRSNDFVGIVNSHSRTLSKFGVHSVSAGSVRVRYNCLVTSPSLAAKEAAAAEALLVNSKTSVMRRTVEDILQTFRASADNAKFSSTGASSRSLMGLSRSGLGLRESSRSSRVAEILARTRAKVAATRREQSLMAPSDSKSVGRDSTESPLHMATLLGTEVGRQQSRYPPTKGRYDDDEEEEDVNVQESSTLIKKTK